MFCPRQENKNFVVVENSDVENSDVENSDVENSDVEKHLILKIARSF